MMCSLPNETGRRGGKTSYSGLAPGVPPLNIKKSKGVTPDNVHNPTAFPAKDAGEAVWFLMRAAYGKEALAKEILEGKGLEVFLPLTPYETLVRGKRHIILRSLIPNFLFVHSSELILKDLVGRPPLEFFHHYYVPNKDEHGAPIGKKGLKPLVIPDGQMEIFRRWHDIDDANKRFLVENGQELTFGDEVLITSGKFAGISGKVCRYKRQSRVGVHIEGLGTIVTAFIPKEFMRKIER